ncbi:hypothetical protein [Streptomyces sp. YPW6]
MRATDGVRVFVAFRVDAFCVGRLVAVRERVRVRVLVRVRVGAL